MDQEINQVMAIVVTHNRKRLLDRCLKALFCQTAEVAYICVIDNASTDDTKDLISKYEELYPKRIIYHRMINNMGGAGGFNKGFHCAMEVPNWNWLIVMDDDAAPCPDYVEKLLLAAEKNPEVRGYIGTEYVGYSDRIAYGGRRIIESERTVREKIIPHENYHQPYFYVDLVTFVGLMLHRSVVEKTGYPDETLFIYYDDTDYCMRVRKHTKIMHVTDAKIVHREDFEKDVMGNSQKEWRKYYLYRNELVIKKRYIPSLFIRYGWIGKACLRRISKSLKEENGKLRGIKLTLRATFDVLRNKLGKAEYIHYE